MDCITTDVLIIGAGLGGQRAAIEAHKSGASVALVSKGKPASFYKLSPTRGMQVPLDKRDESTLFDEIISTGLGETDEKLAEVLVQEAAMCQQELVSMGVRFLDQRVPGCFSTVPRAFVIPDLDNLNEALSSKLTNVIYDTMIVSLLTSNGRVCGAIGINKEGQYIKFSANAVVVAAGGGGGLFNNTLTVPSIVGSSYVLASQAGAKVKNLEFSQIMIGIREGPEFFNKDMFLQSPAICDSNGRDILSQYYPKESLHKALVERSSHFPFSTRDSSYSIDVALARAAERQGARIKVGGTGYNVAPFAHASNGGIVINERCETSVEGLYACGEAATGMHGADRIGGAMVTAALVFGKRAGRYAAAKATRERNINIASPKVDLPTADPKGGLDKGEIRNFEKTIKDLMTSKAMIIRDKQEILQAIPIVKLVQSVLNKKSFRDVSSMWKHYELKSMTDYAGILLESFLNRPESKGPHYFLR